MRHSKTGYVIVLGLLAAGCRDDLRPITSEWTALSAQWDTKVEGLKADEAEQTKKLNGLCSTEGLDPQNVASKTCADVAVTTQSDQAQLETLTKAAARHRALVDAAIARGKRLEAEVALDAAKTEMTMLLARTADNAHLRREAGLTLQKAVTSEFEAAKAAAIAAEAKAVLWRQAASERKPLELTEIRFSRGTTQLESADAGPQTQLQDLLAWANTCDGLTFSITAHESKELPAAEAKKLTQGRAVAVQKFLIENGIALTRIASATGSGSKNPIVEEPDPGSEVAKKLNPDELEAVRAKNRRITIQAVNVCPPPDERAELLRP